MKTIKHTRLREAQWRTIIADWQASDINRRQYCDQHNLVYHQFLYWCRKIQGEQYDESIDQPTFMHCTLKSTESAAEPTEPTQNSFIEIATPNGYALKVYDVTSCQLLRRVLHELEVSVC